MIIIKRKCEYCGGEFEVKSAFSKTKYCELHREAGRAEKIREYKRRSYQRYKKRRNIESLGTINLGPHALEDPLQEEKVIKKLLPGNKVIPTNIKGKQYNYNISTNSHEYGDPTPTGIMNTHKGATFDDYSNNAVTYWMEVTGKCPECGSTRRLKDRTRSETACKCGLILNAAPHRGFKTPDTTKRAPFQQFSHEHQEHKKRIKEQREALECGSNAKNANTVSNTTPKATNTNRPNVQDVGT